MNKLRDPRFLTNKTQSMLIALNADVEPPQGDDGITPIRSTDDGALFVRDPSMRYDSVGRLMVRTMSDDHGSFQQLKQTELVPENPVVMIEPDVEPFPSRDATFQCFMTITNIATKDVTITARMYFKLLKNEGTRVPYQVSKIQIDAPSGDDVIKPFNTFDFEYNPALFGAPMPDPLLLEFTTRDMPPGGKVYISAFFVFTKVFFTGPGGPFTGP